jgi:double-stranded uracil-DNA glycosylase
VPRPSLRRLRADGDDHPCRAAPAALRDHRHGRGSAPRARGAHRRAARRARSGIESPSAVPDVLAPGLRVVFCGINPGRVSAAAGAHFANPRNDFWRLLHAARFTPRLYAPSEQLALLAEGIGITNAAPRTTPGSGDLRRADFAGAAERLERLARELEPGWIGFVGKEAYRGAFGERPALGLQARTLGATRLFVLPSTSPANAAVPWRERLRLFHELSGRASGLPLRQAVRAIVATPDKRTLLLRYFNEFDEWWIPPGGGIEPGESDEETLRREIREEIGIEEYELGPLLYENERYFMLEPGFGGQRNRNYLVRVPFFEAQVVSEAEGARWFTLDELASMPYPPYDLDCLLRSASDW